MISIMKKNKCLLLPCTLLVVGLMTISVPFDGSAQITKENLKEYLPRPTQEQNNLVQSKSRNPKSGKKGKGNSNATKSNTTKPVEVIKDSVASNSRAQDFMPNNQGKEANGGNPVDKLKNAYSNTEGGEGIYISQIINVETSKTEDERKIDASRKAEEELEQQIDAVYEAGLKLKEEIKKAEAERDGFNGAEADYNKLDVKCLELRSQYEILVLQLEELQAEYDKLIGE